MATVRIYKVAELLNTSSQEVIALLKRDHGIEVKSASSTIEEVVARQFVDRLARQRNLNVPSNASFADTPARGQGHGSRRQGAGAAQAGGAVAAAAAPGQERQAGGTAAATLEPGAIAAPSARPSPSGARRPRATPSLP